MAEVVKAKSCQPHCPFEDCEVSTTLGMHAFGQVGQQLARLHR